MKTHPLNITYLVIGLIYLGVAGSWALRESGVIDFGEVRWLLPMTLVVAGGIGLVAFTARGLRSRDRAREDAGYDTPYGHGTEGDER